MLLSPGPGSVDSNGPINGGSRRGCQGRGRSCEIAINGQGLLLEKRPSLFSRDVVRFGFDGD